MGEVGANAAETTAPADSTDPKENGDVNGTDSTGATTTTAVKRKHAPSIVAETVPEEEENGTDGDSVVADDDGDDDGDPCAEKDAPEPADVPRTATAASPAATSVTEKPPEKAQTSEAAATTTVTEKKEKMADGVAAPSGGKAETSDEDETAATDNNQSSREDADAPGSESASVRLDRSGRAKDTKQTVVDRESDTEAMDVDDEGSAGEQNGSQNGAEKQDSRSATPGSKVDAQQEDVTEVDDEPMEVDGSGESNATNGHKDANARTDSTAGRSERHTDSKASKGKEKPMANTAVNAAVKPVTHIPPEKDIDEDEADDDKPVSINSDSDSEEDLSERRERIQSESPVPSGKPAKAANVILVGDGGLAKHGEGSVAVAPVTGEKNAKERVARNGVAVATSNQNGDCDGYSTVLSDKEEDDCVLIEDDDDDSEGSPPMSHNNSTTISTPTNFRRNSNIRSRRTGGPATLLAGGVNPVAMVAMQQQQLQLQQQQQEGSMDDDDDDIEEIIDDSVMVNSAASLNRSAIGSLAYQNNASLYKGQGQKSLLVNSTASPAGKEPTLVIIDTMMNNSSPRTPMNLSAMSSSGSPGGVGVTSLLAKAGNAGILPNVNSPGFNSRSLLNNPGMVNANSPGGMMGTGGMMGKANAAALNPVTPLLPALTDDMFVLEAPSFIVPYIYEKPPVDNLRDIVDELEVKIKEMRKKLEESGAVPPADKANAAGEAAAAATEPSKEGENGKKDADAATDGAEKESDKQNYNKKRKRTRDDDDDEWDELDTSTDDEASDEEQKTKVLIKEAKADIEAIKEHIISPTDKDDLTGGSGTGGANDPKKSENYFENPLGKFFMNIGINLVQEFVQTDLLRQQKRKRDREGKPSPSTQLAINSLMKNLEQSKENNKPYKFEMKRCEYCPFKSESALVMAHHYETPHMRNFIYKCNFCAYETRPPHDILYHMEAVHNIKGRMEKALSYHHCPNCPFEDNGKSKLARHAVACAKKFRPELNLNPPIDWEPPAKIPRIKPKHGLVGTATAYQAMTAQQQKNLALANQQRLNQQQVVTSSVHLQQQQQQQHLVHGQLQQQQVVGQQHLGLAGSNAVAAAASLGAVNLANLSPAAQAVAIRARAAAVGAGVGGAGSAAGVVGGRAPAIIPSPTGITAAAAGMRTAGGGAGGVGGGMNASALAASAAAIRNTLAGAGMVISNNLQLSASALAAAAAGGFSKFMPKSILTAGRSLLSNSNASITIQNATNMKTTKTAQAPSISITPLPRQSASSNSSAAANMSNIAGALSKLQAQGTSAVKPGQSPSGGKTAFVVCEICDGYIKDLDQLRNHMQWIHKVKIHPKMIYNRPPLNCQKCQYRFFTDQGLERHLLGSHGLVTSSMQEAANKGKDAGRCPVCGRVYQWKLLNHVSRDHNMTLKPAHLSYKCTVCTATFGMYKQFESHVYSAHSTVAKKTGDGKSSKGMGGGGAGGQLQGSSMGGAGGGGGSSSGGGGLRNPFVGGGDSLLKPLKINDEITIIPQPTSNSSKMAKTIELESHVLD